MFLYFFNSVYVMLANCFAMLEIKVSGAGQALHDQCTYCILVPVKVNVLPLNNSIAVYGLLKGRDKRLRWRSDC